MGKIYVVSHCILNTFSKTLHDMSEDYTAEENARLAFLETAKKEGAMLIQLPCPEFLMYGGDRWGHSRSQFDNPFYRENCRKILAPFVMQIEEYSRMGGFSIEIVGIDGSPSCGVSRSFDAESYGGEMSRKDFSQRLKTGFLAEKPGVFMEVLSSMLTEKDMDITFKTLREL